jgi:putative membrane protein
MTAEQSPKGRVSAPHGLDGGSGADDISIELASRRTGMSFQRTRMSADRTLMSVIRTSLSLISFGFTIYQFFHSLQGENVVHATRSPRNFGLTLVWLGVAMVGIGILFHIQFMLGLRHQRGEMKHAGLIHGESHFPGSYTLGVAILVLLLGLGVIANLTLGTGPFG